MNIHNLTMGDKINGLYYGVFFNGRLAYSRPNTANYKLTLLSIILDKTILIDGEKRHDLLLELYSDGTGKWKTVEIWGLEHDRTYQMANRFEVLENSPVNAVLLYAEMHRQSQDRTDALHERGIGWSNDTIGALAHEITIRWSCDVLIRRYKEIIQEQIALRV